MVINEFVRTILMVLKKVGYVYSTKTLCLFKYLSCLRVQFVKGQSKTKEVYLLYYIVPRTKVMTVFKLYSKNLKNYFPISQKKRTNFTVVVDDVNVRSTSWQPRDPTIEGTNIEALTFYYEFEQVINEPTHILPKSSSCIDLIFADKLNLIMKNGVCPCFQIKCHYQIIY